MALTWLRNNQKRVLIPLTVLIIVTFVFLYGMEGGPGMGGGDIVVAVDGQKVTRQEYVEYQRALASIGVRNPQAPYFYMIEAAAARKIGLEVAPDEMREAVRSWVRSRQPDVRRVTDELYREELGAWGLTPAVLERMLRDYILSTKLAGIGERAGYVTDHEAYLTYSRENLRLEISYADFSVDDFLDEAGEPSEDELLAAFEEAASLDPADPKAYASAPRAAVEYVLFSSRDAAESAEKARKALQSLGADDLAGPFGGVSGGLESAALAAGREAAIAEHYERTKPLYRLPDEEVEEGDETAEAPEPRYQPLAEVRDRIERELAQSAGPGAASSRSKELLDDLEGQAQQQILGPSALTAGLGAAGYAAAGITEMSVRAAALASMAEEFGGVHGLTSLRTKEQLGTISGVGRTQSIADEALRRGAAGDFRATGPTWVQGGYVVWRVTGYEAARGLSYDEAKDEVAKRIRRARAVELARDAALAFLDRLETGELDLSALEKSRTLVASIPQAEPYIKLAVHELPIEPAAFDRQGRSAGFQADDAGLFRVGVVTERIVPTMADFEEDEGWRQRSRTAMVMDLVRAQYVGDSWRVEARSKVDRRELAPLE